MGNKKRSTLGHKRKGKRAGNTKSKMYVAHVYSILLFIVRVRDRLNINA